MTILNLSQTNRIASRISASVAVAIFQGTLALGHFAKVETEIPAFKLDDVDFFKQGVVLARCTRMHGDLATDKRIEVMPPVDQHIGREVFDPVHWGRLQQQSRQFPRTRRRNGRHRCGWILDRRVAQARQVGPGKLPREFERRRQARLQRAGGQIQQPV